MAAEWQRVRAPTRIIPVDTLSNSGFGVIFTSYDVTNMHELLSNYYIKQQFNNTTCILLISNV